MPRHSFIEGGNCDVGQQQNSFGIEKSAAEFLRRRASERPISTANMIRRARYAFPRLAVFDDELERMIAEEIVAVGGNIAFDRHTNDRVERDPGH